VFLRLAWHSCRCVSELCKTPDRRLSPPLPSYLHRKAQKDRAPCLRLANLGDGSPPRPEGSPSTRGKRRQGDDEEVDHTLQHVLFTLSPQLYHELWLGLGMPRKTGVRGEEAARASP
jgi:hypothetical protein